ncbi:MAG: type II toxin-antitoxin system RelE/ParE family toxin [bacterium]|nr:type II toxin-antitoxin system RelE/ParE family toxin [bacterium]
MEIFYTSKSAGQLENLPRPVQKRIVGKMRFYVAQKNPLKFAKRLIDYNEGEYRFRIGDYRIIFDVKDGIVYVLKIDKRDKVYD